MSPPLTLGEKQRLFTKLVGQLILKAYDLGYELTFGYTYRSPEENARIGGHAKSNHVRKLAVDLNLFKHGEWLTNSEAHRPLGEWWVQQHELCRWGGNFTRRDGNHYSLEHEGVA